MVPFAAPMFPHKFEVLLASINVILLKVKLTRSYWNLSSSNFEVPVDYFFTAGGWGESTW